MNTPSSKESVDLPSADEPPPLQEARVRSARQWVDMVDPPREHLNGRKQAYYALRTKDLINPAASGEYPHMLSVGEVRAAIAEDRLRPALQLERPLNRRIDFTDRSPSLAGMHTVRAEMLTRILMVVDGVEQFAGPGKFYAALNEDPELEHALYGISLRQGAGIYGRIHNIYPDKTIHIAVNVGQEALEDPDFVQRTLGILQQAGARPGTVGLELLESITPNSVDNNIGKLREINDMVPTSNDDCPDQHSVQNANVLRAHGLPIERLKVSGGYVKGMANGSVTPDQYNEHLAWALRCKPKGIVLEGFAGVRAGVVRQLQQVVCQTKQEHPHTPGVFEFEGCVEREGQEIAL